MNPIGAASYRAAGGGCVDGNSGLGQYTGIGCFGSAYAAMYQNDTHAFGSVDRSFYAEMVLLNRATAPWLYGSFTEEHPAVPMGRPQLDALASSLHRGEDAATVDAIVDHCRRQIVEPFDTPAHDMVFGGTEEAILARGTDWCTDIARVCCALCQASGLGARIVITANTRLPYCGHTVVECYYDCQWGVLDPTFGIVYRDAAGRPASVQTLRAQPALVAEAFARRHPTMTHLFPPAQQYLSAAFVNYDAACPKQYDYSESSLNAYTAGILSHSEQGWPHGLRWLYGEDH
jgi:hypothetical protein